MILKDLTTYSKDHKLYRLLDMDVLKEQWTADKPLSVETELHNIYESSRRIFGTMRESIGMARN